MLAKQKKLKNIFLPYVNAAEAGGILNLKLYRRQIRTWLSPFNQPSY